MHFMTKNTGVESWCITVRARGQHARWQCEQPTRAVEQCADGGRWQVRRALDRGSMSQEMDREWIIGPRRAAHREK
jgi:hypothetical protein